MSEAGADSAMESVPIIRTKFVDLTETAGQGLLSEMSVAEVPSLMSLLELWTMCECYVVNLVFTVASRATSSHEGS